jgi:D-alanyl-D-alanine carboxypeptidase/D-alanyl-D-alanine-endopeptidase (penicillin-binding protein 4)
LSRAVALLLLLALPAQAEAQGFHELNEKGAALLLRRIHEEHPRFIDRLIALSARFLGARYASSPLGEGPGARYDPDPTFDLRRVDCLTLVEQILAMAHTPDLQRAKALLQWIRYDGALVDFARRRHFAMSQWIPGNQALGVIEEVTNRIGGPVLTARKRLDTATWRGKWARWPGRLGGHLPRGEFTLPVIPIDAALRLSERFPVGSLVSIVRVDRPTTPIRITHQGLVVMKNGRRYLRHASSGPRFRRVIDYPLRAYFRFSRSYFRERWPVLGVNVQRFRESPRLAHAAR